MAVAYRSSNVVKYATRTNTVITAPSGIQDGDILFIVFDIGGSSLPSVTPPSGFVAVPGYTPVTNTDAGFSVKTYAWWKAASSESGNYTVTHASASTEAYMAAVSGADTTTPFSPAPTTNTGTGFTTTALGLTAPANSSLVIFFSSDWGTLTNTLSAPTGTTPTFSVRATQPSTALMLVADGVKTSGATGNKSATNNNNSAEPWAGIMFSIQTANSMTPLTQTVSDTISMTDALISSLVAQEVTFMPGNWVVF